MININPIILLFLFTNLLCFIQHVKLYSILDSLVIQNTNLNFLHNKYSIDRMMFSFLVLELMLLFHLILNYVGLLCKTQHACNKIQIVYECVHFYMYAHLQGRWILFNIMSNIAYFLLLLSLSSSVILIVKVPFTF